MANNSSQAAVRRPTADQLRRELDRMEKKRGMPFALKLILFLIVILLVAAITFFCLLSGYMIYGDSMAPMLQEKDLVLGIPNVSPQRGDLIAFRYEDRVLIKRAIAGPGDTVEVLADGHVRLNGSELSELYALYSEGSANDMTYPLTVPAGAWFVLGDNRGNSVDSRSVIIGPVDESRIIGKVFLRIWPLNRISLFDRDFLTELPSVFRHS